MPQFWMKIFPLYFVGDYFPEYEVSSVMLDPCDSMSKIIRHLQQLGHEHIHFLTVDYNSPNLIERKQAFLEAAEEASCPVSSDHIWQTVLGEASSVKDLIAQMMKNKTRPTALVCISDSLALEAMVQLTRLGHRIPQDIAVTGVGNLPLSENPLISLTTVDGCREERGRRAAQLILKKIRDRKNTNDTQSHILLKGSLITRQTTLGEDDD